MQAATIHEFGDFDVFRHEEIETPEPKPGHVLIRILAAGVNRFDHYVREGAVVPELPFPHILGTDAAGEVAALGAGVEGFAIGEPVVPAPGYPLNEEDKDVYPASAAPSFALPGLHVPGTYAQYIEVPARYVVKDDTGLPSERVATLPVALATSVRALKDVGGVKSGDKVLVQAGASGSGTMLIQVAKALGAEVATTVRSDAKGELAKSVGADLIINTRQGDFVTEVQEWAGGQGADVVVDNLGGDVLAKSIEAARPLGVIVAYGFAAGPEVSFDVRSLFFGQKQLRGSMASDPTNLQWGLEQVRAGRIKPVLDRSLPLSEAAEAHRLIAANQVAGKLALLPWA